MRIYSSLMKRLYRNSNLAYRMLRPFISVRRMLLDRQQKSSIAVIERLKTLALEDICVSVKEFEGKFTLSPKSHLLHRILLEGNYEPDLVRITLHHLNVTRDAIDIGANIGFFSVLFGKHLTNGRVLSVEPSALARERLLKNLKNNGISPERYIIFNGLIGSKDEAGHLNVIEGMEEYSSAAKVMHPAVTGNKSHIEEVPQASLDTLVRQHSLNPGFIKIDVEGFEMEALKGAEWTLMTYRPVILMELSDPLLRLNGTCSRDIVTFLSRLGYTTTDPLFPGLKAGVRSYGDLLALPEKA